MRFTAQRAELLNAAKAASRIIPVNTPIDSIKGLLFSANAEKGIVEVTGTDIRTRITKRVPITGNPQSGDFVIGAVIKDILNLMNGETVTFDDSFTGMINISCNHTVYELPYMQAKEFPASSMTFPDTFVTVNDLNKLIKKSSFATEKNVTSPTVKQNLHIMLRPGESFSEATDGNRLIYAKSEGVCDGELSLFLHNSAINVLSSLLSGNQTMYAGVSNQYAVFFNSDTIVSTMMMNGSLPDMNTFISQITPDYKAYADTSVLKNALETALCCQLSGDDSCVNIVFCENTIVIKAQAYKRNSVISVNAVCNTPTDDAGFNYNPRYILDFLNLCSGDISLTANTKGFLLIEDKSCRYLVSPRGPVSIHIPQEKAKSDTKETAKKTTAKKQTKKSVKKAA